MGGKSLPGEEQREGNICHIRTQDESKNPPSPPILGVVSRLSVNKGEALLLFTSVTNNNTIMTRGNQRELARQKNAKKQSEMSKKKGSSEKGGNKGMSLEERRHRDAEIMREKQLKKEGGK
uniref:Small EDRK-rich factor-like N-terminal domain-containing protein n=1 Tax=Amphimedon queenslandica TaxID=400682 RepID=A0A1X7UV44_AMPQE